MIRMPSDAIEELEHPTRLAIARACMDAPLTVAGIAGRLDKKPGAVGNVISRLERNGILERTGAAGPRGGIQYRVAAKYRTAVSEARSTRARGGPRVGERLLLVGTKSVANLSLALAALDPATITWAARVDGAGLRLLIAIAPNHASTTDRVEAASQLADVDCMQCVVSEVLTGEALLNHVAAITGVAGKAVIGPHRIDT